MPNTSSAEPDRLFRFVVAAGDVDAGLSSEATALGAALDRVLRTCEGFCGPLPRLDRDLAELRHELDQVARLFLDAALRFLAADGGPGWGIGSPPPPLSMLLLLADEPPLGRRDLDEIGRALLGLAGPVKPAIDGFGRMLTGPTSILSSPGIRPPGESLTATSAAKRIFGGLARFSGTPVAGLAQRGLGALTLLEDANRLRRDGNPLDAWHHKGAGYVADLAGTGFDVTSSACARAPSYAVCGAAAVSGAVWVTAETWQHREGLAEAAVATSREVMTEARRVRGLASRALDAAGTAQQDLIDSIRNVDNDRGLVRFPRFVTHAVADTIEQTARLAGGAVSGTQHLVSSGWRWLSH